MHKNSSSYSRMFLPLIISAALTILAALPGSVVRGQESVKGSKTGKTIAEKKNGKIAPPQKKKEEPTAAEKEEKIAQWIMDTLDFGINRDRREAINKILTLKNTDLKSKLGGKLVGILKDETDPDVAIKAITILGEMKDARGTEEMIRRLDDQSEDVRTSAVYGLKNLDARSAKDNLIAKLEKEDLSKHNNFIESLINTLGAFKAEEMIPFTEKALESDKTHEAIREYLVLFLGRLDSKKSKDILLKLYKDEDEELTVRSYAVNSIAKLKIGEAAGDIKQVLSDIESYNFDKRKKYYSLYIYSVAALASMGDKDAVPKLMSTLRSDNTSVRLKAVLMLKDLKNERTIDILKYRMKYDPSRKVRKAARSVLKEYGIEVGDEEKTPEGQDEQSED